MLRVLAFCSSRENALEFDSECRIVSVFCTVLN